MINVSQNYLNAVNHYTRDIVTRVYFNGSDEAIVDDIISVKVKEGGQSSNTLSFGNLCCNEATVKMRISDSIALENGYFVVEHGILVNGEYEYVSMGTYYISEIECIKDQYTITGYDCSTRLNEDYTPTITLPCLVEDIVKDICQQCLITLDDTYVFSNITIDTLYEGNCKETLCYMASLMGKNVKISREKKLTFYWWGDCSYVIDRNIQYIDGFTRNTDEDIVFHSLVSGSEDRVLSSGNGRSMSFVNPYMTQEILDSLLVKVDGFTYTPATIEYRGNPALEIGDIVYVEDDEGNIKRCIIGEHEFDLTGMKAILSSLGMTEVENTISSSPTEIKLKKMYKVLQNAFKDSTDLIIGAKGGYFVIDRDDDGYPTGFKIMDTPSLTSYTKGWIFNKNGLGYSKDGFVTLTNIAIDMNGHINANAIVTGSLTGENFELNLEEGSIIMGERDDSGEFSNIWFKVNQDGLEINLVNEIMKKVVTRVEVMYALSDSYKNAPADGWSNQAPEYQDYMYMWQKTVMTYGDDSIEESEPTCISGATGQGIDNIIAEFYLSSSKEELLDGEWNEEKPEWIEGFYLWKRDKIVYKNPYDVQYTTPICDSSWDIVNDTKIEGCSIISSAHSFVESDGNYNPYEIVLTPSLYNCHFDIWFYSTDLGATYHMIIPADTISYEDEDSIVYETDAVGIYFKSNTNELIISNEADCFLLSTAVVFKLKTDIESISNTITIIKNSDVATKVEDITFQINQLKEECHSLLLDLDSINNAIVSKVEEIEKVSTDEIETINTKLSEVIQTASKIEEQFTTLKQTVDENGDELESITTYIRKSAEGIEVGELEANIKTLMTSSYFAILFNDEASMKLEQSLLTIQKIKALTGFQLGQSIFSVNDHGFYMTWGGD